MTLTLSAPFILRLSRISVTGVVMAFAVSDAGEDKSGAKLESTLDPVLQPGIVEEFRGETVAFFNQRSPIRATASLEAYQDDNIFILPEGEEIGDFTWEILPEVIYESSEPDVRKRNYLTFGYDPQILRFATYSGNDAFNHRAMGRYRFQSNHLNLDLFHRSAQFSGTNREIEGVFFENIDSDIGRRADGDQHLSKAISQWSLTEELVLESSASRFARNFESEFLPGSEEWRGESYLINQLTSKTRIGLGTRLGEIRIDDSPNHVYQDILARMAYTPSPKLTVDLGGGVDLRQFNGAGAENDQNEVIFASRITWQNSESTRVFLEAFRDVYYAVNGDSIVRNAVRGSIRQRLSRNLYYEFRGGYEWRDYEASRLKTLVEREDNFFFLINQLDYEMSDWGTISLFHEFRENDTTVATSFERNQLGFRLSIFY